MEIKVSLLPEEKRGSVPEDESQLGFGKIFTDHMYTTFFKDGNWRESCIEPFGPFVLSPAALVLHYGQEIFEGMKAFCQTNKKDVSLFRPEKNAERMKDSAKRMSMEPLPEDQFLDVLHKLIDIERKWVPHNPGTSLYIRPTMIATESLLGHRKSNEYLFYIILSPVGPYFKEGFKPIRIYVEPEYVRAVKGGVGEAKTGGNYAATLLAMDKAFELGCSQVMWLDASEHKYIEEVGTMNQFFVLDDVIYTAPIAGTVLKGVTRESVITLAKDKGYKVKEEFLSIETAIESIESGNLTEAFGAGTAASIAPVGELHYKDKKYVIKNNEVGPISKDLYESLTGIQYGRIEDPYGWNVVIK
ncbi:MAG: branched-chain amino acid aminotransferase [Candidatus Heimdallarchaeota archaeon]|nr:branched-chain amino acid aminotransferase [Candidatus Heimdallarchaeota archaeon]